MFTIKYFIMYMILKNLSYNIKSKIMSYYIIDELKIQLNEEVLYYHTKNTVKKILNEIIENVLKELLEDDI